MPKIDLSYGSAIVTVDYDEHQFDVLRSSIDTPGLSDKDLGDSVDHPLGSGQLSDIVGLGETVLFVVPDATRTVGAGQVINLLVRRLIANGTSPHEMAVIFATGMHRKVSEKEKYEILTPFIAQRIKTIDHDPMNLMGIVRLGETAEGISIELNRALFEFDHLITIGGVNFHYFAGFTGGRKLICPGLASSGTIAATHKLAFNCTTLDRAKGVGPGRLSDNPVHLSFVEAASKAKVSFAVNTIVNERGGITALFCGDPIESHLSACELFNDQNSVRVDNKRDLVIASCGGDPHDLNLIQAHKALENAVHACKTGGMIVLLAECREGLGQDNMIDWFSAADSRALAARLCARYKVNGQTAWNLLRRAEQFDIRLATSLSDEHLRRMRLGRISFDELKDLIAIAGREGRSGFFLPESSTIRVITD